MIDRKCPWNLDTSTKGLGGQRGAQRVNRRWNFVERASSVCIADVCSSCVGAASARELKQMMCDDVVMNPEVFLWTHCEHKWLNVLFTWFWGCTPLHSPLHFSVGRSETLWCSLTWFWSSYSPACLFTVFCTLLPAYRTTLCPPVIFSFPVL